MSTRPATLGSSLDLKTLADVDAALHELGWLQQQTAQVKPRTQAAVNRLTAEAAERLQVEIDGQPVAFADRSKALEGALVKWCGAKLARHLDEAGNHRHRSKRTSRGKLVASDRLHPARWPQAGRGSFCVAIT